MLQLRLSDKVSAAIIRRRTRLTDWFDCALRRILKFAKQLATATGDNWAIRMSHWKPHLKRPLGRPRSRWSDDFATALKSVAKNFQLAQVTSVDPSLLVHSCRPHLDKHE